MAGRYLYIYLTARVQLTSQADKIILNQRNPNPTFPSRQLNVRPDTTLLKPEKIDDFMAGEMRVNEHPFLTTLHIIFVKEHNRIAKLLKEYLPSALHDVSLNFGLDCSPKTNLL